MFISTNIKSVYELMQTFSTEQACIDYLEEVIWNGIVVSPFDSTSQVYKCKDNRYRCRNTGKYFNIRTGTMFESSNVSLRKWFLAMWLITSHKKGISSTQLAKDIGVTQKTAWFLLQRIRACFGIENCNELEGIVECDEAYISGRNINRHADKKIPHSQGRSVHKNKFAVMGMIQREESEIIERPHKVIPSKTVTEKVIHKVSKMNAFVVPNTKRKSIQPLIYKYIKTGTKVISDEWTAYSGLIKDYDHKIIDHSKKEYVSLQDNTVHTNNVEGSWKILKNAVCGTYNRVSKKHLQKYCNEFVYRYNLRKVTDHKKFEHLVINNNVRTKYRELIA